jgi:predicted negative regulator of RcsB-dependent stress response
MATHLDLEEQEQLDRLKHFWATWGNLITGVLVVVALGVIGWQGWQYHQRSKAVGAAALYDEMLRASENGDTARVERALADMKDKFAGTTYAPQAGLLAAKTLRDKGNTAASQAALAWVSDEASDPGYQAVARLRLSAELMQAKSYDEALKLLDKSVPKEFEALVADRKGDIYLAQNKRDQARTAYEQAWRGLDPQDGYRRMVEIKLNAVGVDPSTLTTKP